MAKANQLPEKKQALLAEILKGQSTRKAAETLGMNYSTARSWRIQPAFQEALAEGRAELWDNLIARVLAASTAALKTLVETIQAEDAPHHAKVSASSKLLDMAVKLYGLKELENRITKLEAHQNGHTGSARSQT